MELQRSYVYIRKMAPRDEYLRQQTSSEEQQLEASRKDQPWSLSPVLRRRLQKVINCFHGIFFTEPTGWQSLTSALQMPSPAVEYWKSRRHPSRRKALVPSVAASDSWQGRRLSTTYHCTLCLICRMFSPSRGTFSFRIINHPFLYVVYLQEEEPLLDGQLLSSILVETVVHQTVLQKWKTLCGSVCPVLFLVRVEPSCERPPNTSSSYSWITVEKQWGVMFDSIK